MTKVVNPSAVLASRGRLDSSASPLLHAFLDFGWEARLLAVVTCIALFSARGASAATDTWTGGGADANWMTTGNWNTLPVAMDILAFDGNTNTTTNNNFTANTQFNGITFAATAGAFTLGGNAVLLGGDINDNSTTQPETISLPLLLDGATSNVNVASGGSLALGTLTFGLAAGSTNVSTLNVNNTVSATSLSVRTNTTAANTITIANGATLTIAGGFTVGVAPTSASTNTVLNINGGGTLNITSATTASFNVGVGNNSNSLGGVPLATMDMSGTTTLSTGLSNFIFSTGTGSFGVGNLVTRSSSLLYLANTSNSITAATVGVGDSNQSSGGNNANLGSILYLGAGTNVINANTINVGFTKSLGSIQFLAGTGSVTIGGEAGGASTANITIGRATVGTYSAATTRLPFDQILLAGHTANIQAGTVVIGSVAGATGGTPKGVMTFDTGTFTVDSLQLAVDSSGSPPITGIFTLGTDATSTGVLNVNTSFFLGNVTNAGAATRTDAATFTINGGTANINTNIQSFIVAAATHTTVNSELDLQGGTLNMNGFAIGTAAAPITTVKLLTTATSTSATATLENLGGAGISGAGLTMNGAGTLLLGPNTYTGDTSLASGIVQLNDANSVQNSAINMSGAGTLQFAPSIHTFNVGGLKGSGAIPLADTAAAAVNLNLGAAGGSYSGILSGSGGLTVAGTTGTTIQTLTGSSTYSGNTTINSGTLRVKGHLLYSDPGTPGTVGVAGGTLAGDGQISTAVTMTSGTIAPDATGSSLHLKSLAMSGGTLQFTLAGSTIGNILVDNAANLNSGALQFALSGPPVAGTYTILSAGSLHNSLSLSDQVVGLTDFHPFISGNMLDVTVTGAPSALIWVGANNSGAWDIATTKNWNNTTTSTNPDFFHNADNVAFDNSSTHLAVNITSAVQPASVTFTNNSSHNYVVSSSNGNGIGGATGLLVNSSDGTGTVTLNTANTYSGDTTVSSGTLIIGSGGVVASANANVNGGTLRIASGGSFTGTNATVASGAAMTVVSGGLIPATLSLIDNGTVSFNSDQTITTLNGTNPAAALNETGTLTVSGGGSFAGAINNDGPGSLTVAGGTLILIGANTYTGATTISSGATLQIDDGSNAGSLSSSTAITNDGTLIFARTDTTTVSNIIGGAGTFEQNGPGGTLTLTGNNSYSGGTSVNAGTLVQGSANALGNPAGGVVLGTPEPVTGGVTTPSGNLTLNFNTAVGSFSNTAGTATGTVTPSVLTINQGLVLTDNGDFTVGFRNTTNSNQAINTSLTVTGGGSLVVIGAGNVNIGQASNNGGGKDITRVDMSGLNSVTVDTTGSFNVGFGANDQGNLTLAGTTVNSVTPVNSINATAINVGNSASDNDPGVSTLNLGAGANTLDANTITIGSGKTGGVVQFISGAPPTASVTIAGTGGGTATANIAVGTANSVSFGNRNSTLLLAGHPATVQAGTVIVGQEAGTTSSGTPNGSITFDTGTFSANSLQLAIDVSGTSASGSVGAFTLGTDNTSTGVLSVGGGSPTAFFLANNTNTTAGTVTGTFTINGGTANIQCSISDPSTNGTSNTTLNLNGGTLNMNGFAIGGDGTGSTGRAITNVNLLTNGGTATLANLGGGGINNAGLNMNGTGTLSLTGLNNYTGPTTVSSGTLQLVNASANNNIPNSSTIIVAGGANFDVTGLTGGALVLGSGTVAQTLGGGGTVTGSVTVNAGSALAGASGATLTVTGSVTLQNQSHSAFALGAPNGSGDAATSLVNISGGAFSVAGTNLVDLSGAAQTGTYELYAFTSGTPSSSQFKFNSNTAGAFSYAFNVIPNLEVDLVVTQIASAAWNFNSNGNFSDVTKWDPQLLPSGPSAMATFGVGTTNTVNAPNVTVLIDGADVVGSLVFNNTKGTAYTLGNDSVAVHGITLNDNGSGATVSDTANAQQRIFAKLILAENTTFNIAGGSSLLVSVGGISETGGSERVTLTGGGTLTIDTPSSYTGGTTVTAGTLTTTATGTLGPGTLAVSAADTIQSAVNLGRNQAVSALSGTLAGSGTARVSVAAGTTLTVNQATPTTFAGNLVLGTGATANGGGTLTKSGTGTLEIDGAPILSANSNLNVNGGTLRFNVTPTSSGSVFVGTGVTATVSSSAVLELAGSVSALDPVALKGKANVVNNSTAPAGLLVSGTNQLVGFVDGAGTTQVNDGSDLKANHIVQGALVIGTTGSSPSLVTIDASDSNGNPLASGGGLALAGSLAPSAPFGSGASLGTSLLAAGDSSSSGLSLSGGAVGGVRLGGSAAVPEPATLLLAILGAAGFGLLTRRRREWMRRLTA